jgi:serine/threonine protein kinase
MPLIEQLLFWSRALFIPGISLAPFGRYSRKRLTLGGVTMVDRVGQLLDNYRLIRLLGQGGFAEVYLAEHLRLNTQVAIKVLHTSMEDEEVEGFLREAQNVGRLRHPHIVRVFDFDVQERTPFVVMDQPDRCNV